MRHHTDLYPVHDMVSDTYRMPKWEENGVVLFFPFFIVVFGLVSMVSILCGIPVWIVVTFCSITTAYGMISDVIHDSFHLRKFFLQRFAFYMRLRRLHLVHHVNMGQNFGILSFLWDRVFGTYKE